MSIRPWDEMQLRFDLPGLDEVEEDAQERAITPEQARQISAAARQLFETTEHTEHTEEAGWFEEYLMLVGHGWPWRVAAYIAWASVPKIGREPATLKDLAEKVLGLGSPRVISNWRRKYPSIDAVISMMRSKELYEHKADFYRSLVEVASIPDYKSFNHLKLALELLGDYVPRSQMQISGSAKDLSELSDEELDRLMGTEGLTTEHTENTEGEG